LDDDEEEEKGEKELVSEAVAENRSTSARSSLPAGMKSCWDESVTAGERGAGEPKQRCFR
jgi:hypothetical protein